jgi:hypothetical protein
MTGGDRLAAWLRAPAPGTPRVSGTPVAGAIRLAGKVLSHAAPASHPAALSHGAARSHGATLLRVLAVGHGLAHHVALVVTATPGKAFHPTPTALPGGAALQTLVNGIGGWALIIALAGLVIGAAMWALGAHSQNYQQSFVGKRAVLVSGLAALIIGAAPVIVDFFFHTGLQIPLTQ